LQIYMYIYIYIYIYIYNFIEQINNSAMKDDFKSLPIREFWVSACKNRQIAEKTLRVLVQFSTIYLF